MVKRKPKRNRAGNPPERSAVKSVLSRLGAVAGRLLVGLALCACLSAGLLAAYAAAASSSIFQVKRPLVSGTRHLSRLEVLSAAGIDSDSNLAQMQVNRIEDRVKRLPWVKDAVAQRRLPGILEILVTEYDPAHLAMVAGKLYFVSRNMDAFTPVKAHEGLPDLPVITGLTLGNLIRPTPGCLALLNAAAELMAALPPQEREAGGALSEIHLDEVWGLSLVYGSIGPTVRLGLKNYTSKLLRLGRVLDDLKARDELSRVQLIDLSHPKRTVVRF